MFANWPQNTKKKPYLLISTRQNTMARSHPSTNRTSRPLLLEARVCVPKEEETNPLEIINTLLAFQEPKELIGWLSSNTKENTTKLIKFIVAVRD